jgi:hypothetical protein
LALAAFSFSFFFLETYRGGILLGLGVGSFVSRLLFFFFSLLSIYSRGGILLSLGLVSVLA